MLPDPAHCRALDPSSWLWLHERRVLLGSNLWLDHEALNAFQSTEYHVGRHHYNLAMLVYVHERGDELSLQRPCIIHG